MTSALCFFFGWYNDDYRALCCFLLLEWCLARSVLFLIVTMMFSALCVVFLLLLWFLARSFVLLIVTMLISALCFVFGWYNDDYRALCCLLLLRWCLARFAFFLLLRWWLECSVLSLIVTMTFSALCIVFYCYDEDLRALCYFWLVAWLLVRSLWFFLGTMMNSVLGFVLIVTMMTTRRIPIYRARGPFFERTVTFWVWRQILKSKAVE